MAGNYSELTTELFKAVDVLIDKKVNELAYDKTVVCQIVDNSNREKGIYVVSDGSTQFEAFSDNTKLTLHSYVYVTIPQGDYSNGKMIVGKYTSEKNDYYSYTSPYDSLIDMTGNIILYEDDVDNIKGLTANLKEDSAIVLWESENLNFSTEYSRLGIKGNFKTVLSNVASGTYGLRLYIAEEGNNNTENIHLLEMTNKDMYGDSYNFLVSTSQNKLFDISQLNKIKAIRLELFQNNDFYDKKEKRIEPIPIDSNNENNNKYVKNIFIEDFAINLGYDTEEYKDSDVILYTLDSQLYSPYKEENNNKTLEIKLIVSDENGKKNVITANANGEYNEKEWLYADNDTTFPAKIHWYRYNKYKTDEADVLAGPYWEEIFFDDKKKMTQNIDMDVRENENIFKVIIENPTSDYITSTSYEIESFQELKRKKEAAEETLQNLNESKKNSQTQLEVLKELKQIFSSDKTQNYSNYLADIKRNRENIETQNFNNSKLLKKYNQELKEYQNNSIKAMNDYNVYKLYFTKFFEDTFYDEEKIFEEGSLKNELQKHWFPVDEENQEKIDRNLIETAFRGTLNYSFLDSYRESLNIPEDIYNSLQLFMDDPVEYQSNLFNNITWIEKDANVIVVNPEAGKKYRILAYDYYQYYLEEKIKQLQNNINKISLLTTENSENNEKLLQKEEVLEKLMEVAEIENQESLYYSISSLAQEIGLMGVQLDDMYQETLEKCNEDITQYKNAVYEMKRQQTLYISNDLTFKNEVTVPDKIVSNAFDAFSLDIDNAGYNGNYYIYGDDGSILNSFDSSLTRKIELVYTGNEQLNQSVNQKITWRFPLKGSMIAPPQLGKEYSEDDIIFYYDDNNMKVSENEASYAIIEYKNDTPNICKFRIKDKYISSAFNNSIICIIDYYGLKITKTASLTFGQSGNNGTNYTLTLELSNNGIFFPGLDEMTITPHLYDKDLKEIIPLNNYVFKYTLSSNQDFYFYEDDGVYSPSVIVNSSTGESTFYVRTDNNIEHNFKYNLLSASVNIDIEDEITPTIEEEDNIEEKIVRTIQLKTLVPISYSKNLNYRYTGVEKIIYDTYGANPSYYSENCKIFDENNREISGLEWKVFIEDSEKENSNFDSTTANTFYPSFPTGSSKINVPKMFLDGLGGVCICAAAGDEVYWIQPLIIKKNTHNSSLLNNWNGNLTIDKNNGTILSTMIGAGKKEENNSFTGVLMGDIAPSGLQNKDNKIGLYGFSKGVNTFALREDGVATFGASGKGQIVIDGTSGKIQSATYDTTNKTGSGLLIDFETGSFKGYKAENAQISITPDKDTFFLINGYSKEDNKYKPLLKISKNGAYIKSLNGNVKMDLTNNYLLLESKTLTSYLLLTSENNRLKLVLGTDSDNTKDTLKENSDFSNCFSVKMDEDNRGLEVLMKISKAEVFKLNKSSFIIQSLEKTTLIDPFTNKPTGKEEPITMFNLNKGDIICQKGRIGPFTLDEYGFKTVNTKFKETGFYLGTEGLSYNSGSTEYCDFCIYPTPYKFLSGKNIETTVYCGGSAAFASTIYVKTNGQYYGYTPKKSDFISGGGSVGGNTDPADAGTDLVTKSTITELVNSINSALNKISDKGVSISSPTTGYTNGKHSHGYSSNVTGQNENTIYYIGYQVTGGNEKKDFESEDQYL